MHEVDSNAPPVIDRGLRGASLARCGGGGGDDAGGARHFGVDADEQERLDHDRFGDAAERDGCQLTAGSYYLRAAIYYFCGERFIPPSERKWDTYRSCLRCFRKGIARRYPTIERVEVPYEGTTLPAWSASSA